MNSNPINVTHHAWYFACIVTLIVASVLPRFYALGDIGFQGDEEYTAFAASAVLAGKEASLPSGMPYRRSLPLTYLSAASAALLGSEKESSYRLPATLLGAFTPVILFFFLRSILGGSVAFVIALAIAFSEWHILVSREARMYAPFLLFFTCSAICIWRWVETNRLQYLLAGILLFLISMTLHQLTLLATMFVFLPFVTSNKTAVSLPRAIMLFLFLLIPTFLYYRYYVDTGYAFFPRVYESSGFGKLVTELFEKLPVKHGVFILLLAASGGAVGFWLARARRQGTDKLDMSLVGIFAYYLLAIMTGLFTFAGLVYAAVMTGILFFTVRTGLPPIRIKAIYLPLGLLVVTASGWLIFAILTLGMHDGVKNLASVPFPYLAYFLVISPGGTLLFLLACGYAIVAEKNTSDALRFSIFATIIPILLIGLVQDWGGARYVINAYPFLIFSAVIGLMILLGLIARKTGWWGNRGTVLLAVIIVASGAFGGSGIPNAIRAATLGYSDPDYWSALGFPSQPDHRSAGRYVSDHLNESDIVIAEDASMQKWYSGKVDFWLRKYSDAKQFLYQASDGNQYDIYVSSRIVTEANLDDFVSMAGPTRRIWIITSGETSHDRTYFLSDYQLQWLSQIERTYEPRHIGRDSTTKVYCLGCD